MADAKKITELPSHATWAGTDLVEVVRDPAGVPVNEKGTLADLGAFLGGGYPLVPLAPFSVAGWTWVNQGPATVIETGHAVFMTCPSVAGENIRALVKSLPAGTPTITVGLIPVTWRLNYCSLGLALRESATGKLVSFMFDTYVSARQISGRRNTSPTAFASSMTATPYIAAPPTVWYFRSQFTAAQYVFSWSLDGVNFLPYLTENKNAFFTTAPDQIGLMQMNNCGTSISASFVHWSETA
jgi:hypothetical protein